jgi:cob(I)alamin adenosyltransferase
MPTFYTRAGDDGTTGLLGKGRISKADLRMETIGAIDEVNAALGLARSITRSAENATIVQIQRDLYGLMGELAATNENAARFRTIGAERVRWLEEQTDRLAGTVKLPGEFIVPGDSPAAGAIDMARAITRRAERRLVELAQRGDVANKELQRYLNRLSSFCYLLELHENDLSGVKALTLMKG